MTQTTRTGLRSLFFFAGLVISGSRTFSLRDWKRKKGEGQKRNG